MDKPFSIIVQETEQEIINTINKSNLPAYVLKNIFKEIYQQLENIEQEEIDKYNQSKKKGDKK